MRIGYRIIQSSTLKMGLTILLILALIQFLPPEQNNDYYAAASTTWTQKTSDEFAAGNFEKTIQNEDGNVILGYEPTFLTDQFNDESKISQKDNVIVDTAKGEVKLKSSPSSNITINRTFGGYSRDEAFSVQQTNDDGYIILGRTQSYGAGNEDIWLIKINKYGNEEWNRIFGGTEDDYGHAVQQTNDGGYILTGNTDSFGQGSSDLWLIKTNELGLEQWNLTYGGPYSDWGSDVKQTSDNGYILAGTSGSYGSNSLDIWLVKTSNNGNIEWQRTFGSNYLDWGYSVQETKDKGFIITGTENSISSPNEDISLIKVDNLGNTEWYRTFGGTGRDWCSYLQQTSDDGFIIVGKSNSYNTGDNDDIILIKTNKNGHEQWVRTYGGPELDWGYSVTETIDGGFILTGRTASFGNGGTDVWMIKTTVNGFMEWNKTYGGVSGDSGASIKQTIDGGFVIVGETYSYGSGSTDIWLIKTKCFDFANLGSIRSRNLIKGQSKKQIKSFEYSAVLQDQTSMKIQFSIDNNRWFNSQNKLNIWDTINSGDHVINLTNFDIKGSMFYYRIIFISEKIHHQPLLFKISISYDQYTSAGYFISQPFNCGIDKNYLTLGWRSTEPPGTNIKFQLRTSETLEGLTYEYFIGPDGEANLYYSIKDDPIWSGHHYRNWIQVKAYLSTTDNSVTPILEQITIYLNYLPELPEFITPINTTIVNSSTPTFTWEYKDRDSTEQYGFRWQLDDSMEFDSVDFDSDNIDSELSSYTPSTPIPDGIWHWRVRTQDDHGQWGRYNGYSTVMIDTMINEPENVTITPNNWTNINTFTISWSNPADQTWIVGVYYKFGSPPTSYNDGTLVEGENIDELFNIRLISEGEHSIYIWLKDKAGNIGYKNFSEVKLHYDITRPACAINLTCNPNNWSSVNSFQIDWENPEDISGLKSGAYYYVSIDPPLGDDDGTWLSGKPINITGLSEGENSIYIWLEDRAGNRDYRNSVSTVLKLDSTPPTIQHSPIKGDPEQDVFTITATVTDDLSGVGEVILCFKRTEDINYTSLPMEKSGNTYSLTLLSDEISPGSWEYYIMALDNSTPANIIYYGQHGLVKSKPRATSDLDFEITKEPEDKNDLTVYYASLVLSIIIILLLIGVIIYIKKKRRTKPVVEPTVIVSNDDDHDEFTYTHSTSTKPLQPTQTSPTTQSLHYPHPPPMHHSQAHYHGQYGPAHQPPPPIPTIKCIKCGAIFRGLKVCPNCGLVRPV